MTIHTLDIISASNWYKRPVLGGGEISVGLRRGGVTFWVFSEYMIFIKVAGWLQSTRPARK